MWDTNSRWMNEGGNFTRRSDMAATAHVALREQRHTVAVVDIEREDALPAQLSLIVDDQGVVAERDVLDEAASHLNVVVKQAGDRRRDPRVAPKEIRAEAGAGLDP